MGAHPPGNDGALALGLASVIIAEEIYDADFVANWCHGFEEFATYVQHYRPEVVEQITGIPADRVVSLARRIARARGASFAIHRIEYATPAFRPSGSLHPLGISGTWMSPAAGVLG